ncbi:hypothetical protein LCGC14_2329060, partial [marine sediment metagenome]
MGRESLEVINIRAVDLSSDLPMVIEGMRDFIARMDYHEFLPDTYEEIVEGLTRLVSLDPIEMLVAEYEGSIVGGIGMVYSPCIWNLKVSIAEEMFWWVSKDAPSSTALRLLRRVSSNAVAKGCKFIVFKSLSSSPETLDKVYRRMGLRLVETSYMGIT